MKNKCKLFLISSATYSQSPGDEGSYVKVMHSFIKRYPNIQSASECHHLSGREVFYSESCTDPDVSEISVERAINMAREFSMCSVKNFSEAYHPTEQDRSNFHIASCQANLLYDSHAFFAIVYDITLTYEAGESENSIISAIFSNRDILGNLEITEYVNNCRMLAIEKIYGILQEVGLDIKPGTIQFKDDSTLPFILFSSSFEVDRSLFKNEEVVSTIGESNHITSDYAGSFFHPGWNYTVACGLPYEVLVNLVQMMIRAQSFFFSLGYMKSYYTEELGRTIKEKNSVEEFHVGTAEDIQLAFYKLLAQFNSYKNMIFPKYHKEFCALMDRWHCDDDIDDIKSYIGLDLQSKERIHSKKIEKQNDRQNNALAFIALIQLISIYGAFADGSAIFTENLSLFIIGTIAWTTSLLVFLIVSKYFRWAIGYIFLVSLSLYGAMKYFNPLG